MTAHATSPSEKRQEIVRWLVSEDASTAPLEVVEQAVRCIESDAIGFAEDNASPKQIAFQKAFETRKDGDRRVDIFAAMGANRSGKTYVGCWMCFAKHLRDHAKPGGWYWCISLNLDRSVGGQQRELWEALPRWMFKDQKWDLKIGFGMHRKVKLELPGGGDCLVEFRSADQEPSTFEQAKLDGVWVDESLPEAIYDRILARIIDRRGFIIITDIYEQFWYMRRLREAPLDAGVFFQVLTMFDNEKNLPEGEIAKAKARWSEENQRLRIYGELIALEGLVYKQFIDSIHSIDPFPNGIPDWPKFRAIDYGASAPTACVWFMIAPNEHIYIYREYYETGLSVAMNAEAIVAASGNEEYVQTFIDPHAIDPPPVYYGASKTIAEQYAEGGIKTTGWPYVNVMGEHAMVQRVKSRLENRTLWVFKTCENTRREFRSWMYQLDTDGKPKEKDAYEHSNNHALDCIKGFVGTNPTNAQFQVGVYSNG